MKKMCLYGVLKRNNFRENSEEMTDNLFSFSFVKRNIILVKKAKISFVF